MHKANLTAPTRRSLVLGLAAGAVAQTLNGEPDKTSQALSSFQPESVRLLQTVLSDNQFRGHVPTSVVDALMKSESLSRDALTLKLLPLAQSFAHPPISEYFVGAVAIGNAGLYLGCNIEMPGGTLGLAVHAEQSAIANAYMSDESAVEAIAVRGSPCGHCRQFLSEVALEQTMRVLTPDAPVMKLSELLPRPFGPKYLGFSQGALPVRRTQLSLALDTHDSLILEALRAATGAYTPYSKSTSGIALDTSTRRKFAGSYIENAAFNPSLPPLQAALAGYFAAGSHAGEIRRVVLVEGQNSAVSHEVTTRSTLASIAPNARFERLTLSGAAPR
jgi:cytidine deaminase